jgi:hypothetical protein
MLERSAPTTLLGRPGGHGSDDPREIGLGPRIAVDRHMLRNIEFQPLDIAEQHHRVFSDVRRIVSLRRRIDESRRGGLPVPSLATRVHC